MVFNLAQSFTARLCGTSFTLPRHGSRRGLILPRRQSDKGEAGRTCPRNMGCLSVSIRHTEYLKSTELMYSGITGSRGTLHIRASSTGRSQHRCCWVTQSPLSDSGSSSAGSSSTESSVRRSSIFLRSRTARSCLYASLQDEEIHLVRYFGDAYVNFRQRTGHWLPVNTTYVPPRSRHSVASGVGDSLNSGRKSQ